MTIVSLLILIAAIIIVLQNGRVQTMISVKVLNTLTELINGDITLDKIQIQPFNTIVIKNITIKDKNPFIPSPEIAAEYGTQVPVDTFFRAEYITLRYSLRGLLEGNGIMASSAVISNGQFNLVLEGGDDTNLTRIFRLTTPENPEPQVGRLFSIKRTEINDLRFTMVSLSSDRVEVSEGGIDWNDLDINDIYLQASDIYFEDNCMAGELERMSFKEKSGYVCNKIRGSAKVGNGKTLIKDFHLEDPWSRVHLDDFSMSYDSVEDFADFLNKIVLDADLGDAHISFKTIGHFAPETQCFNQEIDIKSAKMHGIISDFIANDIKVETAGGEFVTEASVRITGIPDVEKMHFDFNVKEIGFTSKGLETFVNGWIPDGTSSLQLSHLAEGEYLRVSGTGSGLLNDLNVNMDIISDFGTAKAGMYMKDVARTDVPIIMGGKFQTYDIDLGTILGNDILKQCSLDTGLEARFDKGSGMPSVRLDSLKINRLHFNNYDYNNIIAVGKLDDNLFDGRIICNEPNLNFMLQGAFALSPKTKNAIYKFYANIGFIDLNALNFDKRGVSQASLWASANINNINRRDIVGNIDIKDISLVNSTGKYPLGDLSITGHTNNDIFRANMKSDFADLNFTSTGSISDFIDDMVDISLKRELPDLFEDSQTKERYHSHELSLKLHDTRNLLAFALPGIYIADDTRLGVHIDTTGLINANISSQRIAHKTTFIKDVVGRVSNEDQILGAEIDFSCFNGGNFILENDSIELYADRNNFGAYFSYDNMNGETMGELMASGSIERQEDGHIDLDLFLNPSRISLNGSEWDIEKTEARLRKEGIRISHFGIKNKDQRITINGGISTSDQRDTLNLYMDKFRIATIDDLFTTEIGLGGILSGDAELSSTGKSFGIEMSIESDSTSIANKNIGTLVADCTWDKVFHKFDIIAYNKIDSISTFNIDASFSPAAQIVDAEAELNGLDLGYLQPIVKDIFSEFSGKVYGKLKANGPIQELSISSQDTRVEDGLMTIAFTNVPYDVYGPVRLSERGVFFDNVQISDKKGGTGAVNGSLYWNYFQDMGLDVHATANNLLCIDTTQELNEYFYGNLTGSGKIAITGPMEKITLAVEASTTRPGELHIPLSSGSVATTTNLLKYTKKQTEEIDPYEEMLIRLKKEESTVADLTVKVRANATPDVNAFIEIDKASGNVIQGRGNGTIDMDITPDTFNLRGDYTISSGSYKFVALGLASRDFLIQDGSTIRFNGDVMETNLDIDATYRTKASLSTLISDTTSVNTRKVVECGINISEKLLNPRVKFSINIPDVDPTVKAKVENALSSEDKIQKQFLSLILSNSFLPDEQSGIVNNSSILYSNVTEMMANQLNNILTRLEIPLDLGLNYQPNERGNDIFDVAVSTQLFNNRVEVSGNLGNRQYRGSSTSDIVGDLDIGIKIDRPGNLRLTLFSHSADQYTNYLDNSQRNGVGVTFQQEFNKIIPFFKSIFKSKKEKEEEQLRNMTIEVPKKVISIKKNDNIKE